MQLASVDHLSTTAGELAGYLHTLQSNDRDRFDEIEQFILRVFPEYRRVNLFNTNNTVQVTLTNRASGTPVPLSHCGTGVEQLLIIATFLVTAGDDALLLLDEPHSYLHPVAERQLLSFFHRFSDRQIVCSTHSPILINSVPATSVTYLGSASEAKSPAEHDPISSVLFDLGFRNSDLLFFDEIVFVEGPTEEAVLPILLSKIQPGTARFTNTGFIPMGGAGRLKAKKSQDSILHFERLLRVFGRARLPRIYLFDGDCEPGSKKLLQRTPNVNVHFLPKREIENYLLNPAAILAAMLEQARAAFPDGVEEIKKLTRADIEKEISALIADTKDKALYPDDNAQAGADYVKGSVVLERIFEKRQLVFDKTGGSQLIARHIDATGSTLIELFKFIEAALPA